MLVITIRCIYYLRLKGWVFAMQSIGLFLQVKLTARLLVQHIGRARTLPILSSSPNIPGLVGSRIIVHTYWNPLTIWSSAAYMLWYFVLDFRESPLTDSLLHYIIRSCWLSASSRSHLLTPSIHSFGLVSPLLPRFPTVWNSLESKPVSCTDWRMNGWCCSLGLQNSSMVMSAFHLLVGTAVNSLDQYGR